MKKRALCYLRTHRRVWGLSQAELGSIVGLSYAQISRIEDGKHAPKLGVVFACQVLFGIPPSDIFPHAYADVEEQAMRNIYRLHEGLGQATTLDELRKRELCALALRRATRRPNTLEEA